MENEDRFPRYKDELRLFGYQMSGSLSFAESLADDVLFIAPGEPAPMREEERSFLYRIATNLCLTALPGRAPRCLPSWEGPPADAPTTSGSEAQEGDRWLRPFPDDLFPEAGCGTSCYDPRETISLEFVGALQHLEPTARAALLLGDVLGLDPKTAAGIVRESPSDPNAALGEIRSSFAGQYPRKGEEREPPPEGDATTMLMKYIFNWETTDQSGLEAMLSDDVVLQAPPSGRWFEGKSDVMRYLASYSLNDEAKGRWRLLPRRANGQMAFGVYERDGSRQLYLAHSIHVVYFTGTSVSEIIAFGYPSLFPLFALLPELTAQGERP